MKASLLLLVFLSFASGLCAAMHKIEMSFDTLSLKNGKTLGPGVIKSYDRISGKVVIQADRQIVSLQLEMLPQEVSDKIVAMVPREDQDEAREQKAESKRAADQASRQSAENAKKSAFESMRASNEQKARAEEAAKASNAERARQLARSAAIQKASRYFRYEYKPGSGSTIIVRQDAQADEPVEVSGWANRYRVCGNIGLEYYDSRGRSFNSSLRNFEALVQFDEHGNAKVVDFSAL